REDVLLVGDEGLVEPVHLELAVARGAREARHPMLKLAELRRSALRVVLDGVLEERARLGVHAGRRPRVDERDDGPVVVALHGVRRVERRERCRSVSDTGEELTGMAVELEALLVVVGQRRLREQDLGQLAIRAGGLVQGLQAFAERRHGLRREDALERATGVARRAGCLARVTEGEDRLDLLFTRGDVDETRAGPG